MKALGLTSLAFGFLVAVSVYAGDEAAQKKDKAAIQGMWKITSLETPKGKDENAVGAVIEFDKDGKNLTFSHNGNTKKGTFTLNPAGKPKEIDIKAPDEDKTIEGIYEFGKDSLKLCLAMNAGDGRPNEFAPKDGKSFIYVILERAK